jgi:hypothetical protein
VDEAQEVERVALVADDEAAEIAQPSEEAFDLPTPLVATQGTAVLGLGDKAHRRHPRLFSDSPAANVAIGINEQHRHVRREVSFALKEEAQLVIGGVVPGHIRPRLFGVDKGHHIEAPPSAKSSTCTP